MQALCEVSRPPAGQEVVQTSSPWPWGRSRGDDVHLVPFPGAPGSALPPASSAGGWAAPPSSLPLAGRLHSALCMTHAPLGVEMPVSSELAQLWGHIWIHLLAPPPDERGGVARGLEERWGWGRVVNHSFLCPLLRAYALPSPPLPPPPSPWIFRMGGQGSDMTLPRGMRRERSKQNTRLLRCRWSRQACCSPSNSCCPPSWPLPPPPRVLTSPSWPATLRTGWRAAYTEAAVWGHVPEVPSCHLYLSQGNKPFLCSSLFFYFLKIYLY